MNSSAADDNGGDDGCGCDVTAKSGNGGNTSPCLPLHLERKDHTSDKCFKKCSNIVLRRQPGIVGMRATSVVGKTFVAVPKMPNIKAHSRCCEEIGLTHH